MTVGDKTYEVENFDEPIEKKNKGFRITTVILLIICLCLFITGAAI